MDELIVASRAVHFAALALLFGAPLFRLVILPHDARGGLPGGRGIELAAGVAALISALGWFAGVAANMAGTWTDVLAPDILQAVVWDTRFGRLWIARLAALVAIIATQAWGRPGRAKDVALAILAGGFAASLVGVGHGMTGAGHGPVVARIHMLADMVHLLCAAAWIGGMFFLGRLLRQVMTGSRTLDVARQALARFSSIGYWAVAFVLISGCINALVMVPRPESLIGSHYGRVLLVKIALAFVLVAIAVANRVLLTPRIMTTATPIGVRALWWSVLVEQGVGILVLTAVALLGTIHPVP